MTGWDSFAGATSFVLPLEGIGLIRMCLQEVGKSLQEVGKGLQEVGKGLQEVGRGLQEVGRGRQAVGKGQQAVERGRQAVGRSRPAVGRSRPAVGRGRQAAGRGVQVLGRGVQRSIASNLSNRKHSPSPVMNISDVIGDRYLQSGPLLVHSTPIHFLRRGPMVRTCKWTAEEVIAKSAEQKDLLVDYGAGLTSRVSQSVLDVVINGSGKLMEGCRKKVDSHASRSATTQLQRQSLREVARFLRDRRKAIGDEFTDDKGTRDTFGLNLTVNARSLVSVTSALEVFMNAANDHADKIAAAGITAEDVAKLKQYQDSIEHREQGQEGKKLSAKASTAARNVLQVEIEKAMVKVVNAAAMVYEDRPEVVALFKSTLPKTKRSSRKRAPKNPSTEPVSK